jgi:hypothetical protein
VAWSRYPCPSVRYTSVAKNIPVHCGARRLDEAEVAILRTDLLRDDQHWHNISSIYGLARVLHVVSMLWESWVAMFPLQEASLPPYIV